MLLTATLRRKGFFSFVLPLTVACAGYYLLFASDLNALLKFSGHYTDLRSDNWWGVYVWDRIDIILLALFAYWGWRQAFRDGRTFAGSLLWIGALALIIFQAITRADYDYWKHSIYLIIMFCAVGRLAVERLDVVGRRRRGSAGPSTKMVGQIQSRQKRHGQFGADHRRHGTDRAAWLL